MALRNFELKTIKIWGDSSILAEEGIYKYSDSNGKQLDKGKYIVLWKLESGNWKMYRDIWTSDLPSVAMVPEKKSASKNDFIDFSHFIFIDFCVYITECSEK